jgi:hypothetical protein
MAPLLPGTGAAIANLGERPAQRVGFVGSDLSDETHQRGLPAPAVGDLIQRVDHQSGHQLASTTAVMIRLPLAPTIRAVSARSSGVADS